MKLESRVKKLEKEISPQLDNLPKRLGYLKHLSAEELAEEMKNLTCQDLLVIATLSKGTR